VCFQKEKRRASLPPPNAWPARSAAATSKHCWPLFSFHCWARSAWSATFLITFFLNIELTSWQVVASWTMSWLAFLVPLPGGLGALEASQVFALGAFGVSAASALGVTLLIRARDLLIGGLGLLLAGRGMAK